MVGFSLVQNIKIVLDQIGVTYRKLCSFSPLYALQTYRTWLPFTGAKHQDCSGPDGCYRHAMRAESYVVLVLSMDCGPIVLGCLSQEQTIMIVLDQIGVIGRQCVQKAIKF